MSDQPHSSRGTSGRPTPPASGHSSRSKSSTLPPGPSIETQDFPGDLPSTAPTPRSPAKFRIPPSPRTVAAESSQKAAKVAIPRLERSIDPTGEDAGRLGGRHRVTHACEPCRRRKTKCSGERAICRHCADFKIACFYADGKRDRVKKQFGTMTEKLAEYEKLLKDLVTRVGDSDSKLIRTSLDKETIYDGDDPLLDSMAEAKTVLTLDLLEIDYESGAKSEASARAGSTAALDRTNKDFTRDQAQATGFMGKITS